LIAENLEHISERGQKRKSSSRWFGALSILLAAVLLILAFSGANWHELLATLAGARLSQVLCYCLIVCIATCLRGLRWWLLLRADKPIPLGTVVWSSVAGQFTNNFIPGRGGDLYRVWYLGKRADSSKSFALATTLTERVTDVVALAVLGVVAMMWLKDVPEWVVNGTRLMAVIGAAGIVGLLAMPILERHIQSIVSRVPLPSSMRDRLQEMIPRFVIGLKALHHPTRAISFVCLTVVILLIDAIGIGVWAAALHLSLPFKHAVLLNTVLNLSQAVPTTPGGLGVFQFLAVTILMPFGFTKAQSLAYIISLQTIFYLLIAALGCIALVKPYRHS
jgi:uncharacterized protein (TIRG00374 family)